MAVFSTGDEVREPGAPLTGTGIYDANRFLLRALLARLGCAVTDLGILPDDPAILRAALARAADGHDLLVTSGGVSTGEEDHVKAAVEVLRRALLLAARDQAGPAGGARGRGRRSLHRPARQPGRRVRHLRPRGAGARRAAVGRERTSRRRRWPVRAGFGYRKKEGRREYVRVRLERAADGALEARKHPREGAGVITSLTETDGLAELPEEVTRVEPGEMIGFLPYAVLR